MNRTQNRGEFRVWIYGPRIQQRVLGIEQVVEVWRPFEDDPIRNHIGDEALIGMEIMPFVPVEIVNPQRKRRHQDEQDGDR